MTTDLHDDNYDEVPGLTVRAIYGTDLGHSSYGEPPPQWLGAGAAAAGLAGPAGQEDLEAVFGLRAGTARVSGCGTEREMPAAPPHRPATALRSARRRRRLGTSGGLGRWRR